MFTTNPSASSDFLSSNSDIISSNFLSNSFVVGIWYALATLITILYGISIPVLVSLIPIRYNPSCSFLYLTTCVSFNEIYSNMNVHIGQCFNISLYPGNELIILYPSSNLHEFNGLIA